MYIDNDNLFLDIRQQVKRDKYRNRKNWKEINPAIKFKYEEWEMRKYIRLGTQKVLNYLLNLDNFHKDIYVSQTRIAQECEISERQVNRILKDLEAKGFIASQFRYWDTCLYKVSSFFHEVKNRISLQDFLWALKYPGRLFSLALLLAHTANNFKNVRLIKENKVLKTLTRELYILKPTPDSNIATQKEVKMSSTGIPPDEGVGKIIKNLGMVLTAEEEKILGQFSETTLTMANNERKRMPSVQYPFRYLLFLCRKFNGKNAMSHNGYYVKMTNSQLNTDKEKCPTRDINKSKQISNSNSIISDTARISQEYSGDELQVKIKKMEKYIKGAEHTYALCKDRASERILEQYKQKLKMYQDALLKKIESNKEDNDVLF